MPAALVQPAVPKLSLLEQVKVTFLKHFWQAGFTLSGVRTLFDNSLGRATWRVPPSAGVACAAHVRCVPASEHEGVRGDLLILKN